MYLANNNHCKKFGVMSGQNNALTLIYSPVHTLFSARSHVHTVLPYSTSAIAISQKGFMMQWHPPHFSFKVTFKISNSELIGQIKITLRTEIIKTVNGLI